MISLIAMIWRAVMTSHSTNCCADVCTMSACLIYHAPSLQAVVQALTRTRCHPACIPPPYRTRLYVIWMLVVTLQCCSFPTDGIACWAQICRKSAVGITWWLCRNQSWSNDAEDRCTPASLICASNSAWSLHQTLLSNLSLHLSTAETLDLYIYNTSNAYLQQHAFRSLGQAVPNEPMLYRSCSKTAWSICLPACLIFASGSAQ